MSFTRSLIKKCLVSKNKKYVVFILTALTLSLPLLSSEIFYIDFLLVLFMYATIAVGWNIIGGYTGYVSFGHVAFFGLGAYTTAILLVRFGLSPFVTCILGGVVAIVFALLIGIPTLKLKGAYFAIATLGLGFVLQLLFLNLGSLTGGGEGLSLPLPPWDIKTSVEIFYYAMFIVFLASVLTTYWLEHSRFGLALKCIRDDELSAETSGIPTAKLKTMAFLLSAFFPAVSGGLFSYYATYIDPITVFDPKISMYAIVFSMLGGSGSVLGPVIGSIILYSVAQTARYLITAPGVDVMVFSAIAVAVIIYLPEGIVGFLKGRSGAK